MTRDDGRHVIQMEFPLYHRRKGKCLVWNATCTDMLSNIASTSLVTGITVEKAPTKKKSKYVQLFNDELLVSVPPVVREYFSSLSRETCCVLADNTGEWRSYYKDLYSNLA